MILRDDPVSDHLTVDAIEGSMTRVELSDGTAVDWPLPACPTACGRATS